MNTTMTTCIRVALLATTLAAASTALAQQAYPTTEAAGAALVDALGQGSADQAKVATVVGPDWKDYIPVGGVDRKDVDAFLTKYREKHAYRVRRDGRQELVIGSDGWSFPIPLSKAGDGWKFDLAAGADEIRTRRIGRNELDVQEAIRAYGDAQADYAEFDRDGDGVLEYAQKFLSSDGKHDGLYWAQVEGGEESPLGPLFGDDTPDGQWHGYQYRILTAQGPSAFRGAYDYRIGDNMSRGFALIAWPAKYADTGVMSFMISHDGQVFEKDMGPESEKLAKAMTRFDPDSSWKEVPEGTTPAAQ